MNDAILAILDENKIDPELITDNGQTAFERLEAAILGCLDEIEGVEI